MNAGFATIVFLASVFMPRVVTAQTPDTFRHVADTTSTETTQLSVYCVGMNNQGRVIVTVLRSTPGVGPELWRSDGAPGETPAVVAQNVNTLCGSINDQGQIAYGQSTGSGIGELIRNTNGIPTPLASSDVFPFFASTYLPAISSNGSVLFQGSGGCSGSAPPPWGIYVAPGGSAVYECSDFAFDYTSAVSMNDNQVVAFVARSATDGAVGIYRGPGTTPLVANTQVLQAFPVINNGGTVAFAGNVDGEFGVYATSDGVTITGVSDPALQVQPGNLFSINDSGLVAYEGGNGIHIGVGAALRAVIAPGDVLDGSTVVNARLWAEGLNNGGQVAFWARLADGREGVYRADPVTTACAGNVTSNVSFSEGRLQLNRKTGVYTQKLRMTIANDGSANIIGPVSLALDNLSAGAMLINRQGTTSCAAPLNSPYVDVNVGGDNIWSRKERITVDLEFSSPSPSISFTRRVLAGSGVR